MKETYNKDLYIIMATLFLNLIVIRHKVGNYTYTEQNVVLKAKYF